MSWLPSQERIEAERCFRSLDRFIATSWPLVETDRYVPGWHVTAISEHLQAVAQGDIKRLIINIPPRHMKSLATSVFFPAWVWLDDPSKRFLFASYAQSLSVRDSVKCRRLIQSPWYNYLMDVYQPPGEQPDGTVAGPFELTGDQNTKIRFDNTRNGYRLATSVDGALTGEGGDIIVVDDPHNVVDGESEAVRRSVLAWWDEAMSTRLNDAKTGAYVIIMQRVHEDDLTGHVLAKNHTNWTHLCLPAFYEGQNRVVNSPLGFVDPRRALREPLWPERFPAEVLTETERSMGQYAAACQLQQRPAPREGGMYKVDMIRRVKAAPETLLSKMVWYWDKAGTEDGGCYTAGVKMGMYRDSNRVVILEVCRGQWSDLQRERVIKHRAEESGPSCATWVEQEPGSGGKDSAKMTIRNLAGLDVRADPVRMDKVSRSRPFSAQMEAGNVDMVEADWNKAYVEELRMFPNGNYRDQADASSGAFSKLIATKVSGGGW